MVLASQYVRGKGAVITQRGILVQEPRGDLLWEDNFDRADETPPTNWTVLSGTWSVENYHISQDAAAIDRIIHKTTGDYEAVEVRAVCLPLQIDAQDVQGGVCARLTDENNLVLAEIDVAAQLLRIYKRDAGTWTILKSSGTLAFTRDKQYAGKLFCRRRYYWAKAYQGYGALSGTIFTRDLINTAKRKTGKVGLKFNYHMHGDDFAVYPFTTPTTFSDTFQALGLISYKWAYSHGMHRSGAAYIYPLVDADGAAWPDFEEFLGEDMDVQVEGYVTGSGQNIGVLARVQDKDNYYMANLYWTSTTAADWKLYKRVGAAWTEIKSGGSLTLAINTWHTIKIRVKGSTITAWVNGANSISVDDGALDYGSAGIRLKNVNTRYRNFSATLLDWLGMTNVAKNKTATASSQYSTSYIPAYAVDGNEATRWASAGGTSHWWKVDLGSIQSVLEIFIKWEAFPYFSAWYIDTSNDDVTYTQRFSSTTTPANTTTYTMLPQDFTCRYIRVRMVMTAAAVVSFYEFQTYAPESL